VILVVVGSSTIPFDRLLAAVDTIPGDEPVLAQHGASTVRPGRATCVEFMDFDEMHEQIRNARVVVTHAGVGTILISLMNGKRPVVVPREQRFGEAVDDHQLELAARLAQDGLVELVLAPDAELAKAAARAAGTSAPLTSDHSLATDLRAHLAEVIGDPLPLAPIGMAAR
jgi:UDP-N-acetylglucosamine transferase subunit ALG13